MSSAPPRRSVRRSPTAPPPSGRKVPLRLSVSGGALGLEIYEDIALDPLVIEDLAWTLPNLPFPVDLSGGVDVFRHRRGVLERLALRASFASLMQHARPRLREALGRAVAAPQLWPLENGVGVGLSAELGALAFDLIWAPSAEAARWVVANARATGGVGVPLAAALRAAETLFAGTAARRGRVLVVSELGRRLARELAPTLGARAPDAGSIGVERLEIDDGGLRHAIVVAATSEVYAPVAAGLWHQLAELSDDPSERLDALGRAVASAPGLASVRWARFEARVELGDEPGALGDAESLEAAASGARARHEVLMRAARRLVERGNVRSAGQLFERALRYVPDDAAATFGLGRALLGADRVDRAMALFERSIELGEAAGTPCHDAQLELARLLVDRCGDHPQAIARVAQVPASSEQKLEALALEARWRAAIGDLRGASLVFARLREACELSGRARGGDVATWLTEAAEFENHSLGDLAAAERHLAAALRIAPRDARVRKLYRQAAAALAKPPR